MIKRSLSFLTLVIFIWLIWSYSGRNLPVAPPNPYLSVIEEINPSDSLDRNIVAIQPYMLPEDYFNESKFNEKIRQYTSAAKQSGFLRNKTTILFPEHFASPLVLLGEKHSLAEKESWKEVKSTFIWSNLFDFFLGYIKTGKTEDRPISAIFRMKAKVMASVYQNSFSDLAIETNSYIIAGSIVLPGPYVKNGEIFIEPNKDLYNVSFVFSPEGEILGDPIIKSHLTSTEANFLSEPTTQTVQNFQLPFARTSILISEDSWFPESYQQILIHQPDLILVPSFCIGNNRMDSPWEGKNLNSLPSFVLTSDVNKITERDAWSKYSIEEKIKSTNSRIGVNVFFKGDFWEFGSDGQPTFLFNGMTLESRKAEKAGIWSLNY